MSIGNLWAKVGDLSIERGTFDLNGEELINIRDTSTGDSETDEDEIWIPLSQLGFFAEEINRLFGYFRSGARRGRRAGEEQLEFPEIDWGRIRK